MVQFAEDSVATNFGSVLKKESPDKVEWNYFFILYYSESKKKPYVWKIEEKYSYISEQEVSAYYQHICTIAQKFYDTNSMAVKVSCFSVNLQDPTMVRQHPDMGMFKPHVPKEKMYINGPTANSEFLKTLQKKHLKKAAL